jgi:hypothetical protein
VVAERLDLTSARTAVARLGLPPGATVADLVAALAGAPRPRPVGPVHTPGRAGFARGLPAEQGYFGSVAGGEPTPHDGVGRPTGRGSRPRSPVAQGERSGRHRESDPPGTAQDRSRGTGPRGVRGAREHRPVESGPVERARPRGPLPARPPIGDDLSLFGLSRRSRSRLGSRLFTLFFTMVFGLILIQMIYSILYP